MKLVLAFDIERSGATDEYETIAIGASVLDENLKELDNFLYLNYYPSETKFEPRCVKEFWSKHTDILSSLTYKGTLSKEDNEKEMINSFQQFRSKWENYAKENSHQLYFVSDNTLYDGGFVNQLIYKHMKGTLPIPYSASTQEYEDFFESTSIIKGILLSNDLSDDWNLWNKLKTIYDLPESKIKENHNPTNDAYNIAFKTQILLNINKYDKICNKKLKM
jgi:hypothetical protein